MRGMRVASFRGMAKNHKQGEAGRIVVPVLMWLLGVPFTIVVLLWLLFFRG
jgi:hypothetical protein